LNPTNRYVILELQKKQPPPTRGWPILKIEIHPRTGQSLQGWFFYACFQDFIEKRYLQLTKIKVSNAITNIPKAIRSLKSYFIRTTSHLCMMEGQRPCSNTIVPCHYGNISHFNVQLFFSPTDHSSTAAFSYLMTKTFHDLTTDTKITLRLRSSSSTSEGATIYDLIFSPSTLMSTPLIAVTFLVKI
jgi:hypothetical protein